MSIQENRTLMNRLFLDAFNEKKLKVLDEICAPDLIYETPETTIEQGRREGLRYLKELMVAKWKAFPDLTYSFDDVVAEDAMIAVGWTLTGTFSAPLEGIPPTQPEAIPPTHKKIRATALTFAHVADGKLTSLRTATYGKTWMQVLQGT